MAELQKLLVMLFAISGVMLGFSGLIVSWSSQYGQDVEGLESASVISQTFNQTESLKNQVESSSVSAADPINGFLVFTNSALQGVSLITNIPGIFLALISDMFGRVNIFPSWTVEILSGVLLCVVVMVILSYVLKIKG